MLNNSISGPNPEGILCRTIFIDYHSSVHHTISVYVSIGLGSHSAQELSPGVPPLSPRESRLRYYAKPRQTEARSTRRERVRRPCQRCSQGAFEGIKCMNLLVLGEAA